MTIMNTNSTNIEPFILHNSYEGVFAIIIAVIGFGSVHVPIRKFNVDDGMFVQFAMSVGILFAGFIISAFYDFPDFEPWVALGGCLWAIANTLSQRVITELGMAVGMLLWMSTNCIVGWSIGKFGLFGIQKKPIENDFLNILGLVALLVGSFCIAFIRKVPRSNQLVEQKISIKTVASTSSKRDSFADKLEHPVGFEKLGAMARTELSFWGRNSERIICIILALVSGFLYCITLVPVFILEERTDLFPDAPRQGIPYVFSHYFGVFMASSTIFVLYTIQKRNKPLINSQIVLPSFIGGVIWALSMAGLILSNDLNGQTITYPLTTTCPGLVACIWSVFYFKEINSKRNYIFLVIAFMFIGSGALFVLLSKIKF